MAGAVDGDHVWKRLCGDWHWCWSRNSDGEDDGEQDGENAVDSGAESDASLGASHAGRRESASGGEPLASAHNEPAGGSEKVVDKIDGDDKDGGGDGEGELDDGRRGAGEGAGAGAQAGDGAGARAQAEVVVESDGIARVVGDQIGHFFAAGRGGDVRHDLGGGVHLTVRYHV